MDLLLARRVLDNLLARYGRQHWWESDNRLADWLSMILIQRTTEANANRALAQLTEAGALKVETLLVMPEADLQALIRPAGFYRQKAAYIRAAMQWFAEKGADFSRFSDRDSEDLRRELLGIKGVGEETADCMLLYLFGRKVFVADQYAIRFFTRLGLSRAQDYAALRRECMPLAEDAALWQCREWHAVIDEHGKIMRRQKAPDEQWLLEG